MAFSFGFSGDDIDTGDETSPSQQPQAPPPPAPSAFPIPGKPQLPPTLEPLASLISRLPSKIAFSCLDVALDDGKTVMQIPRRELWDVRVQLMAEDEGGDGPEGLGQHDVKSGVYEGGFKSWESSVDLVKVLAATDDLYGPEGKPVRVIELGCGTALPSLALFQWSIQSQGKSGFRPFSFIAADYNPTVLQLVTLPNFILAWALAVQSSNPLVKEAFTEDGELELTPELLEAFQTILSESNINLSFLSGAWSSQFVDLTYEAAPTSAAPSTTLILGSETIYSPFALQAFTETIFSILERERGAPDSIAVAVVAAKRLYFGVGGSLDDFIENAKARGGAITQLREEMEGVRRGVVRCALGP
ncbi:hypothetical protein V2G26_000590 [Clonostachys chloroleuca]|uniref:protein-histidine N-methyltransferase n=1 Tax=Clonostachys chloroleuca TaxID=1926264 RepID=A0AA35VMU2_9HYPO|nr:unnamed protein product [Clonostachys chloroleuca]